MMLCVICESVVVLKFFLLFSHCLFLFWFCFFFFKQKTAYEMRISDWSSDVCSSDLHLQCIFAPFRLVWQEVGGFDMKRALAGLAAILTVSCGDADVPAENPPVDAAVQAPVGLVDDSAAMARPLEPVARSEKEKMGRAHV